MVQDGGAFLCQGPVCLRLWTDKGLLRAESLRDGPSPLTPQILSDAKSTSKYLKERGAGTTGGREGDSCKLCQNMHAVLKRTPTRLAPELQRSEVSCMSEFFVSLQQSVDR